MSDLISREQALKAIERLCEKNPALIDTWLVCSLEDIIEELPSEMPDRWLFINENNEPRYWQYNIHNGQISPITDLEDTSITWRVGMPFAEITGHWENIDIIHDRKDAKITDWQQAQCSVCGKWHTKPYMYGIDLDPYCPSCGARMVE